MFGIYVNIINVLLRSVLATALFLILSIPSFLACSRELEEEQYDIQHNVLIKTRDGGIVSAIVVRKKGLTNPLPTILQFTIYVRDKDIDSLKLAADNGYVGAIAYSRGKSASPNPILPYEHDANDAYDVIEWLSQQKWSDGQVGMYGGSYNGFTQWAATKHLHPALKTIVPAAANRPGMGLPMENNIFINPNYEWAFYVGSNKTLNTEVGNDRARFRSMLDTWWKSGAAYQTLDAIDGTPNPFFHRWIAHPSYDDYWQNMVPYENEFAQISIPILTFDGYYNDSQNSSLYYLRQHYLYNPNAEHYLIIGPYDHFGAQKGGEKLLRGYEVDPVALIDPLTITYQWFDYIFKQAEKPQILKDKINAQVMGTNQWQHAQSIDQLSNTQLKLYLTDTQHFGHYQLSPSPNKQVKSLVQNVDFNDRETSLNVDSYPDPIITSQLDLDSGFVFISEPLKKDTTISGSFSGEITVKINKQDFDFGVILLEQLENGNYFHLSNYIGRASYAKDSTLRQLLTPETITTIPFSNTRLVSKRLNKGSRLVVLLNVNKNAFSQLNYGSGKDVSEETYKDGNEPLVVDWYNSSFINIPVLQ